MALKSDFEEASFISSPFVDEVANPPTKAKARKILRHGKVRGKALSKKQRGLFGAIVTGDSPETIVAKNKARKTVRRFLDERGTKAKVR